MPSDQDTYRWLRDIQFHIDKASHFAGGLERADFVNDDMRVYSVTRCLEIISEASRRLPTELTNRYPEILWRQMADAGNVYRHEYQHVAGYSVWDTLTDHLPPLLIAVEKEIATLEPHISLEPKSEPEPEPDLDIDP